MDDRALHRLALERDLVLSLADAGQLGLSPAALAEHARRNGWSRPARGVLLVPGTVLTYRRAVLVVLRATRRSDPVVTGWSAAYLWGMTRTAARRIDVAVHAGRHDPNVADLRLRVEEGSERFRATASVRRSRTLTAPDRTEFEGVPITTPSRTVIDLAAETDVDRLRTVVIDARQRRLLRLAELAATHERVSRYAGRPKIRRILADLDEQDCDSRLEWDFRKEARARGFRPYPRPFPYRCSDGVVIAIDVAFPREWVAGECNGLGSRADRAALATHHLRQNQAVRDGWRPFLIDWTRLKEHPDELFGELAELLSTADRTRAPARAAAPDEVGPRFRGRRRRL